MFVYLNFSADYFFCYKIIDELFSFVRMLTIYKTLIDYVIQNRVLIDDDYEYKTSRILKYRLDVTNSMSFIELKAIYANHQLHR
jgi:flagellar assembly factor FliW